MQLQTGFTLIELMVVIAIVAILSAIGIPTYQGYLQKAALTDMLQTAIHYKTTVDLCAMEYASQESCSAGSNGIPEGKSTRYVSAVVVNAGTIILSGQSTLAGLKVTLRPEWQNDEGQLRWQRYCESSNVSQKTACETLFRFGGDQGEGA
ncbi:MAG: Fimbrial protein [Candidatus Erwinia impunctatus]|nr:Fimbrial protein [Culicoides impunctatus]